MGFSHLERTAGIEPASSAWKAEVMPLYDVRIFENGVPCLDLNQRPIAYEATALTN